MGKTTNSGRRRPTRLYGCVACGTTAEWVEKKPCPKCGGNMRVF